jgi:hypothetical protein
MKADTKSSPIRTEANQRMNSNDIRRALTRLLPSWFIGGLIGLAAAVAFVAGPRVLVWWITLFS